MATPLVKHTHTHTHTHGWMEAVHKDRPAETAAVRKPAFFLPVRK